MPQRNLFKLFIPEHFIPLTQIEISTYHITVTNRAVLEVQLDYNLGSFIFL